MVFGIIIVVAAIVVAVLLNKAKISKIASQVEETVTPAIEEVKEIVKKAEKVAPKAKATKAAGGTTKKVDNKK